MENAYCSCKLTRRTAQRAAKNVGGELTLTSPDADTLNCKDVPQTPARSAISRSSSMGFLIVPY